MSDVLSQDKNLYFTQINRIENVQSRGREIANSIEFNPNLESVYVNAELDFDDARIRGAVFRNTNIKTLVFSGGILVVPAAVGHRLRQMRNLKKLEFFSAELRPEDQPAFAQLLKVQGRQVSEIWLLAVEIGDMGAQAIGQSLRFRSSLTAITIINCGLSEEGLIALGEALQNYSSLTNLELGQTGIILDSPGAQVWARTIEKNTSLKSLRIRVDRIPVASTMLLLGALTANKTLKKVYLEGIELGPKGSLAVARVIAENNILESLDLTGTFDCETDDVDSFYDVGIDLAPIACALAMNRNLKMIHLYGWVVRAGAFPKNAQLYNYTLFKVRLIACHINATVMAAICGMISQYRVLRELCMCECKIGDELTAVLCQGLKRSESLEFLSLTYNQIGSRGALALADLVSGNQTLKELDISDNVIADDGFAFIGKALETNIALEGLYLHILHMYDAVGARGVRALLDGLKVHPTLTEVTLPAQASDLEKCELQFYLDRNEQARPLLNMSLPAGLWPHAIQRVDHHRPSPDLLYFLVKEKCEWFQNDRKSRKRKWGHE
jgi:Ran GTPase-activating protein (RanGAP) involved in mRNA processing and transport